MAKTEVRFCGIMMSPESYDDQVALRAYVTKHCRHFMTPLERRTSEYSVPIVSDSQNATIQKLYAYLEDRDGHVEDVEVVQTFERLDKPTRICAPVDRLLAKCQDELDINRCPKCSRITRSPAAKQCPWCPHAWHDA